MVGLTDLTKWVQTCNNALHQLHAITGPGSVDDRPLSDLEVMPDSSEPSTTALNENQAKRKTSSNLISTFTPPSRKTYQANDLDNPTALSAKELEFQKKTKDSEIGKQ